MEDVLLVPPGRITHLVQLFEDKISTRELFLNAFVLTQNQDLKAYTPVWAKRRDFAEIQVTSTFFDDHQLLKVTTQLEKVAELAGLVKPSWLVAMTERLSQVRYTVRATTWWFRWVAMMSGRVEVNWARTQAIVCEFAYRLARGKNNLP